MSQTLGMMALVVRDYDEAIAYYVGTLGFILIEDTQLSETKRWVVVAPGGDGAHLLVAKAARPEQEARIGDQTGGRVFLLLYTPNFDATYARYRDAGVRFVDRQGRRL